MAAQPDSAEQVCLISACMTGHKAASPQIPEELHMCTSIPSDKEHMTLRLAGGLGEKIQYCPSFFSFMCAS
jgi:hypothetical protein